MFRTALAFLVAASLSFAACTSDEPVCVAGDQLGCRCGDGAYGHQTCDSSGHYPTVCDCVVGAVPDPRSNQ